VAGAVLSPTYIKLCLNSYDALTNTFVLFYVSLSVCSKCRTIYCHIVKMNDNIMMSTSNSTSIYVHLRTVEGETSTVECAHELGRLCEERNVVVNLIPYNQTDVKDPLNCPSPAKIQEFQQIVTSYGCWCFIRRTMGQDIAGACGQLANVVTNEMNIMDKAGGAMLENATSPSPPPDIEDGPFASSTHNKSTSHVPSVGEEGDTPHAPPKSAGKVIMKRILGIVAKQRDGTKERDIISTTRSGVRKEIPIVEDSVGVDVGGAKENNGTSNNSPEHEDENDDVLSKYMQPLVVATTVSFLCVIVSTAFHLVTSHRRGRK
jgi:hypothetical protein